MPIHPEIKKYIGAPYKKENGPLTVKDRNTAMIDGSNCQLLAQLVVEDIKGVPVPKDKLSKEIFEDDRMFPPVDGELEAGDIFLFGKENENDPKHFHKAIYTGENDENDESLLVHNNSVDGHVSIWPLSKFKKHKRYKVLYAVKRFNPIILFSP